MITQIFTGYFFLGLLVIAALFTGWIADRKMKHRERIIMLEKGIEPSARNMNHEWMSFIWLRLGIVFIFGGIGASLPMVISMITSTMTAAVFSTASQFVFIGIGLILAQRIDKKG